jgi:hypothetical protein
MPSDPGDDGDISGRVNPGGDSPGNVLRVINIYIFIHRNGNLLMKIRT